MQVTRLLSCLAFHILNKSSVIVVCVVIVVVDVLYMLLEEILIGTNFVCLCAVFFSIMCFEVRKCSLLLNALMSKFVNSHPHKTLTLSLSLLPFFSNLHSEHN